MRPGLLSNPFSLLSLLPSLALRASKFLPFQGIGNAHRYLIKIFSAQHRLIIREQPDYHPKDLRPDQIKSQLFETQHGVNFVGFRVLPDRIRVRNDNLHRSRRRCRQMQKDFTAGKLSVADLAQRLQSWEAHLLHGDTHRLRRRLFDQLVFTPPPEPRRGVSVFPVVVI